MRDNYLELHPGAPVLSYDQVKRRLRNLSGIITWEHDMCVDSHIAFTGPYAKLERCPHPDCGEPRYDQKKLDASGGLLIRKDNEHFVERARSTRHSESPNIPERVYRDPMLVCANSSTRR